MLLACALADVAGAQGTTPAPAGQTAPAAPATSQSLDAISKALPQIDLKLGEKDGGLRLSGTVGVVVLMGALTLLPTLMLLMTSFTRILVVMHFLKQALGTQTAPPAHLMSALALLLTGFVMAPTLHEVNTTAITPWLDGKIEQPAMMSAAIQPMRAFMLRQVAERDLEAFVEMSQSPAPEKVEDVSTVVLMSAFVTSELRTAFQLGFVLFLPFIIIDVVVSSVLMSMGMFMLPPAMISLPFKLLLFVLVDGWTLLIQSLVAGFR
jgi:flagellar biosynthetic protein FliP